MVTEGLFEDEMENKQMVMRTLIYGLFEMFWNLIQYDQEICKIIILSMSIFCCSIFDLLNIHLFHDASNLVSIEMVS